jgi:hypothetical protein
MVRVSRPCRVLGIFASLNAVTAAKEKNATQYYFTPPDEYESMWIKCVKGTCKGSNASRVQVDGPHFTAYVYYDLPEWAYDKRVIFTSYVQPMPDDCESPNDCDGRTGGNEFDMVETGYVGFNSTWFVNDHVRCETKACNAQKCWNGNVPGCSWEGGPCKQGDYNNCNVQKDPDNMPAPCTWTDVQNGFSMCTQSAALDPMKQDFTQLSANAYVDGKTGVGLWQFMPKGAIQAVNNQRAFAVGTGDGKRWGNRWIRLDLTLKDDMMWYSYSFFEPKPVNDTTAKVASKQEFGLRSLKGNPTFDKTTPHYWIFTMWQYEYEFAVPVNKVWDSMRYLHYYVVQDPLHNDVTSHVVEFAQGLPSNSLSGEVTQSISGAGPSLLVAASSVMAALLAASFVVFHWRRATASELLKRRQLVPSDDVIGGECPALHD